MGAISSLHMHNVHAYFIKYIQRTDVRWLFAGWISFVASLFLCVLVSFFLCAAIANLSRSVRRERKLGIKYTTGASSRQQPICQVKHRFSIFLTQRPSVWSSHFVQRQWSLHNFAPFFAPLIRTYSVYSPCWRRHQNKTRLQSSLLFIRV